MRFTALLAWRKASSEPVPFQERLPLKLKPTVSGKGDKVSEVCCIQEMSVMLACFKTYEFNQALCSKEIDSFKNCYAKHMNTKQVKKEQAEKGILTPGEKKLSYKQVNILLKRYPNHK